MIPISHFSYPIPSIRQGDKWSEEEPPWKQPTEERTTAVLLGQSGRGKWFGHENKTPTDALRRTTAHSSCVVGLPDDGITTPTNRDAITLVGGGRKWRHHWICRVEGNRRSKARRSGLLVQKDDIRSLFLRLEKLGSNPSTMTLRKLRLCVIPTIPINHSPTSKIYTFWYHKLKIDITKHLLPFAQLGC